MIKKKAILFNNDRLVGKVYEKYRSITSFAKAVETDRTTVSLTLNNKRKMTREEVIKYCETLGISKDEIIYYFFDNWDVKTNHEYGKSPQSERR